MPRLLVIAVAALAFAAHGKPPRDFTVVVAGGSGGDGATPALARLEARLAELPAKTTIVIFTGNYAAGELPMPGAPGRAEAERAILAHVTATRAFEGRGGRVYFLAGHRDFADEGTRAVLRTRALLNGAFDGKRDVMPEAACGTPTLLELGPNLGVLLLNSQWLMVERGGDPDFNDGCEAKTRAAVEGALADILRDYRDRRLIIATHHPLRSNGERGGAFTARAHLTPAPVIGTAWVIARQAGLVAQHRAHPRHTAYSEFLRTEAERNGAYVFVSGHEENLQVLPTGRQLQVIAGTTGRTASPIAGEAAGDFGRAVPGWAELAVSASGEGVTRLFGADGARLFEGALPPVPRLSEARLAPAPPLPPGPVTARWSKLPVWQLPGPVKAVVGSYYTAAFDLALPYPVLDLATEAGGLVPYKVGGGGQTNSVRAHDAHGGDWAIRSTTKDSSRLLPYPISTLTPARRVLDHAFTATHPEAAVAVPRLAEAAGVMHLTPRLMYLPDQDGLGRWRGFVGDEVVMLEQRPHALDDGPLPARLGGDAAFKAYDEMVEKLLARPEKHHVDQEAMLRCRLLDMLIGDWDRHRGQWRFAVTPEADGRKRYTPIPLDRDQAFSSYDGLGLTIGRVMIAQARSLQPFTGAYGPIGWLNYNARDFDALMLNRVPRHRWRAIAAELKAAITDAVIDEALATWHPETFALDGQRIAAALKQRRDGLADAGDALYALLARGVDVTGSAQADRFDLWFGADGQVRVEVQARGGGPAWFDRTFDPAETRELRLYALEGDDLLSVHGVPHRAIAIHFVGGEGQDTVAAADPRGTRRDAAAVALYDAEDGAQIAPSITVRDRRSDDAPMNQYEQRENHEPDFGTFLPAAFLNSDNGASIGGTYTHVFQGFKKLPFASQHEVTGFFSTATFGAQLEYRGLFPRSADALDQQLVLSVQSPTHARNFFGLTNVRTDDGEAPDYYRVRQARADARYGLIYGRDRARLGAQLLGQVIDTEATPGRFVATSPDVDPAALGTRVFAGTRLFAETSTYDSTTLPRQGVAVHGSVEGRLDPVRGTDFSITYRLAAAAAIPFDRARRFVLLTRAAVEGIVGPHPFYFAPTLGDAQLRAYHPQQLAGEVAFSHSTDLRIDVVRIASVVPGTIGVHLSADHGRVFGPGAGAGYHLSLGGGLWWSIVDLFGVGVAFHQGLDGGHRITVALGPLFSNTGY